MRSRFSRMARLAVGLLAVASWLVVPTTPAFAAGGIQTVRDSEIERVLHGWLDPILVAARVDPKQVQLILVEDKSVNAFVTDNQTMFVHTGLIASVASPNELKGVLAHETGHIAGGHTSQNDAAIAQAMRPAFVTIGLGILAIAAGAPDAGAALIAGSQQIAQGSFVRHSQAQESQADQAAVTYMETAGQSARGLVDFADRTFRYNEMRSIANIPPWMRTHPLWSDRIQALRARVEQAPHREVVDPPADVHELKLMQAKLYGYTERAAQTFVKYPDSDQSDAARYARAVAAMKISDFPRAHREADSLAKEFPRNPFFQELGGDIRFKEGKFADAAAFHKRALDLLPGDALLQVSAARSILATEDKSRTNEAIALLQAATQTESDNASAWSQLAEAYYKRGDEGLARLATAELHYSVGDWRGARSFAERALTELQRGTPSYLRASDISIISAANLQHG